MIVFSVFFGRLAGLPSDGVPYPLFVYCALLPWQLFANSLNEAASSVVADERLVTKVYFPRLVIPISAVSASIVDFLVSALLLVGMLAWYGIGLGVRVAAVPLFLVMALGAALGVGLWLSALNVQFRDVRYTLPFLTQFWLFASPVAYSSSLVPEAWRWLYGVNPLAGVIEGFRWTLLGTPVSATLILVSWVVIAALLLTGLFYFRRMERSFADVL
jgi:lipopolysaccharide transport system permease protein